MHFKLHKNQIIAILVIPIIPVMVLSIRDVIAEGSNIIEVWRWPKFFASLGFSLTITFCLYAGNTYILRYLNIKMPWGQYLVQRILIEAILTIVYSALTMTLLYTLYANLSSFAEVSRIALFWNVFIAVVITIVAVSIIESIDFFRSWTQSQVETERLQKENIQARFEALKNQLNPHFLFNSLNVLSSLIHKDPDLAEDFVEKLSKVYRYLLENRDRKLVPLKDEVDFLKAYTFLQKSRYGANLQIDLNITSSQDEFYLPPLTLQLLLENAVKHNVIAKDQPLIISIETDDDNYLTVRNNLQERSDREWSAGLGIANLKERYHFFTEVEPKFGTSGNQYFARVPLLKENNL